MKPLFICLFSFLLISCDHGIKPPDLPSQKTGISGTIYYNNWPPADSIENLKLVVFNNFPPDDIVAEVIAGDAIAYPEDLTEKLPIGDDSTAYIMELKAGLYEYVMIAQQYGPGIFTDWRSVGQYDLSLSDSLPTAVTVIQDSVLENINIFVDFNNLPIQPF
ncbi:MAG: hypothetical protein D8M58_08310 [Calditrichaeota bacterium]|nr:MAG: hypothetical protein DWQ03_18180 [Calditrichota bacterium]MBL1205385.1 hypothetical protein [Calditrichota bacterium]NOG45214.1 hypothetical protein [Calditrichota bacterium]